MIDIQAVRKATPLRWVKWLCTLCASFATMVLLGMAINFLNGGLDYSWTVLALGFVTVGIAVVARRVVELMLNDSR